MPLLSLHLPRPPRPWFVALLACAALQAAAATPAHGTGAPTGYDPLATSAGGPAAPLDLVLHDAARDRAIPLRVWLPSTTAAAPVIVFSHGLGGSREGYASVGRHWSARGYVVVHPQHVGSDDAVWRDVPARDRLRAMQDAANVANFVLRAGDVTAVLDALARWNAEPGHALFHRLDLQRVGMAGHSFGAVTTQAVAGQRFGVAGARYTDARIRAAIAMSPSAPRRGDARDAFGGVAIPWLLMTGTRDAAPIGGATPESRRAVYPALPPGGKYELVLADAEHSVFSDRALPFDVAPRREAHRRAILAISTAFWDAWLRGDADARAWLDGDGPQAVLEPADLWQRK